MLCGKQVGPQQIFKICWGPTVSSKSKRGSFASSKRNFLQFEARREAKLFLQSVFFVKLFYAHDGFCES